MKAKKATKLNLEKRRSGFFTMGLLVASSLAMLAFTWTTYDENTLVIPLGDEQVDFTELPPVTVQKPKQVVVKQTTRIDISQPPKLVDNNTVIDTTLVADLPIDTTTITYNPDLFAPDTSGEGGTFGPPEIFVVVENMPCWEKCTYTSETKRKTYTDEQIFTFLAENVRYPRMCVDGGIEGVVWVEYIINAEGKVADAKVVRGAHNLLDKEALRVVNSFPQFAPGKQRTKPVNVKFTLPIRFTLH